MEEAGFRMPEFRIPGIPAERVMPFGIGAIVVLFLILIWSSRPTFVAEEHPPAVPESTVRPLAVTPRAPLPTVFSILGPHPPRAHPDSRDAERYSWGTGLYMDAVNGFVYAITIEVGSRSWRGLRVGMTEREVDGPLALIGQSRETTRGSAQPLIRSGYQLFPSLERRPLRTRTVEVRPPNGCFDVLVELRPRAIGFLDDGGDRFAVVGREGASLEWVTTRIRVVDRSRVGPDAARAC